MFGAGLPSLEIAGLEIGVREGVLALIILVALYIALVLWRMRRLGSKPDRDSLGAPSVAETVQQETEAAPESERGQPMSDSPRDAVASDAFGSASARMASEFMSDGLARELGQLRDEVDVMRGELAALREDMLHEMAHLRAAQTVSPIYGDAVQMAAAGYDAAAIAERCGIARAEAELVVALARSQVQ